MVIDIAKHEAAKLAAGKARKDTAVTRICLRKAAERIGKTAVITQAAETAGYTTSDITRWINAELPEVKFSEKEDSCCYWAWCCNLVIPDKASQTWQAIVYGPEGCLYAIDFKLTEAGIEFVGEPKEVVEKDQFVLVSEIMDESEDESNSRSLATKLSVRNDKVKTGMRFRIFEITPDQADEKTFEIPCSFASEAMGMQRCDPFGEGRTDAEYAAGLQSGDIYVEILSHEPGDTDYTMLNNKGAVLDEHEPMEQIGVVKPGSAHLDRSARVSRCILRMDGNGDKGKMRFRQMKEDIRPHLSAGYRHTKFLRKEKLPSGHMAYHFATSYMEVTSTAIPMDGSVGTDRAMGVGVLYRSMNDLPPVDSLNKNRTTEVPNELEQKANSMTEAEIAAAKAAEQARIDEAVKLARAETETRIRAEEATKTSAAVTSAAGVSEAKLRAQVKEIMAVTDAIIEKRPELIKQARKLATECIEKNISDVDFKIRANTELFGAVPAANQTTMAGIGMKGEEYDLCKAVQNIIIRSDNGRIQGITCPDPDTAEGQAHLRIQKLMGPSTHQDRHNGFLVPADANISSKKLSRNDRARMQRDSTMQATFFPQGGATVQTEVLLPIIEILRNEMVTTELGVTSLSGLEGNIAIPRQTAASTAYALPETGALTLSGQLLDQVVLTPHKVGAWNAYSRQLLLQSTIDLENFMRTDMFAVIALAWDYYILNGQGANDQPTGILNTNGVTLVNGNGSFTGYSGDTAAPAWADIVNFETQIAKLNARRQGRAWATTSNAKGRLKTLARLLVGATTVPSVPLWEGGMDGKGIMNGYPAVDSQQVPNDQLMFGVWMNNVIHGLWGGMNVIVDPYTGASQSIVKIYMDTFGDVAIRHPQEFCISLASASA